MRVSVQQNYDGRDRGAYAHRDPPAIGIASITWSFAVEHFARLLGVEHWLGTVLEDSGGICHVWPHDKAAHLISIWHLSPDTPRQPTAALPLPTLPSATG